MIRLNFLAEGQTEEEFVNGLLRDHLAEKQIWAACRCVFTSRRKKTKGGLVSYEQVRRDLDRWMKEDSKAYFTTMFDFYALPYDFPGFSLAVKKNDPFEKIEILESAFLKDVGSSRLLPYIQLHEFEALLLSDVNAFSSFFIDQLASIESLRNECDEYPSPEHINLERETAPSKRILHHIKGYRKTQAGPIIALEIGLEHMRRRCLHFHNWVTRLEALSH